MNLTQQLTPWIAAISVVLLTTRLYPQQTKSAGFGRIQFDMSNLGYVDLTFTNTTDVGLAHLRGLTRMQTLDLTGTNVSDGGIAYH